MISLITLPKSFMEFVIIEFAEKRYLEVGQTHIVAVFAK